MGRRTLVIAILMALGLLVIYLPGAIQLRTLQATQAELERELMRLAADNARLAHEQEQLLTNPDYMEKVAREQYHMAREGELILKLDEPASTPASSR
ncbi:MAG: septum formation initiator family protein [Candidatus Omnitrophica bacterium]|nr:septum formation initiator family protein [Candidatus Omnitrophota bacterium]